jgi:hypothetical protein
VTVKTHKITVKKTSDPDFEALFDVAPWQATCACGWKSDLRTDEERATRSGAEHLAEEEA